MKTYQDYVKAVSEGRLLEFIREAITEYQADTDYKIALDADEYDAERNVTIMRYVKWLYNAMGQQVPDCTAANNKIASNFLHRLVTQRVSYSLGNGISFPSAKTEIMDNKPVKVDEIKQKLGKKFDTVLYKAGKYARLHKVSFLFWNLDHATFFKMTEFCPLWDEDDGRLKAGLRFWSLDWNRKPVTVVLYEADGYTKFVTRSGSVGLDLVEAEKKRGYKQTVVKTAVDPEEVVAESNYSDLPIIPYWGSDNHQSDLVGMRSKIDTFDMVKSGFANDLEECQEVFWILENAMGMSEPEVNRFRQKLKLEKIAVMDTSNTNIKAYQQEIPVNARDTLLKSIREQIYEDYGGLDVHTIAAGATNDHIDAAYQPMDEEADDFEYQTIEAVQGILALLGYDEVPIFSRNRVSNQKERTDMIINSADHLDEETILRKLPFLTPDEVEQIRLRKIGEGAEAFTTEE